MRVEFEFYATLRDAVGEKTIVRDVDGGSTVAEATRAVADEYDGLESLVFQADGELRPNVTVAVDGDPVFGDPGEVRLSDGDTVVLTPGVSGGSRRRAAGRAAR